MTVISQEALDRLRVQYARAFAHNHGVPYTSVRYVKPSIWRRVLAWHRKLFGGR